MTTASRTSWRIAASPWCASERAGAVWPVTAARKPALVRFGVIGLIALIWLLTPITILRGDSWTEAVTWAVIGAVCLSAVDLGIDLGRRRKNGE